MALVIDNRGAVAGAGVHVLIVGVSEYLNLPEAGDPPADAGWFLNKLTSPALSAFKVHEFLRQETLRLPLKTVRLLLSPSPTEFAIEPLLATVGASRANRAAFETMARDWRDDAKNNPADMTILYFAGHGLQRGSDDGVLLLEDFLSAGPPLAKCFEIGDIKDGMAPSPTYPNIALTQFYFVDACLTRQDTQKKFVNPQVPDVFGAELNIVDRREAPVMFSTVDGAIALGRGGQPSHFSEALILALQRAAEDPEDDPAGGAAAVWPITSLTLKTALDLYYAKHKLGTKVQLGGVIGLPVIRYLPGPPDVDISVEVRPDALGNPCNVWVYDNRGTGVPPCTPTTQTKFDMTVKAGIYSVQVDSGRLHNPPYRSDPKYITQRGTWPWVHNLVPHLKP